MREDAHERIREVIWEWNPLREEPDDPHLPRDEYDWLIRGVEHELAAGADTQKLATYMAEAVRSRYGLASTPPVEAFAARLAASGG